MSVSQAIKQRRIASFLASGPLPVQDLCDIILAYGAWFLEGTLTYTLTGHTDSIRALTVLPDGKLVSASSDKTVRVWDRGKCSLTLKDHKGSVTALAVLPDGKLVTGSDDRTVRVWC